MLCDPHFHHILITYDTDGTKAFLCFQEYGRLSVLVQLVGYCSVYVLSSFI